MISPPVLDTACGRPASNQPKMNAIILVFFMVLFCLEIRCITLADYDELMHIAIATFFFAKL
jgi:hypothetical protein